MSTKPNRDRIPTSDRRRALANPGKIGFDDRGNAIYEWQQVLQSDSADAALLRERALSNPTLSIVEDDGTPSGAILTNKAGSRVGYNPYESGLIAKKSPKKRVDMRALSQWVAAKKLTAHGAG